MFAPSSTDWNWETGRRRLFDAVIRFWFDRGIDGIRIDVADSMAKDRASRPGRPKTRLRNHSEVGRRSVLGQPAVEKDHRRWRAIADSYAGDHLASASSSPRRT